MADELPRLKPPPGELVVECPKCGDKVSETCYAFQGYDYYKECYHWIKSGRDKPVRPRTDDETGMEWWNNLSESERARWSEIAGNTGRPKDAWEAWKLAQGSNVVTLPVIRIERW